MNLEEVSDDIEVLEIKDKKIVYLLYFIKTKINMIIILSWPAWAWKDTIWNWFLDKYKDISIWKIITTTTRPPRDYEKNTIHYNFVDINIFTNLISNNELIEYAQVHWNYYGSSYSDLEKSLEKYDNIIYIVDVKWFINIKNALQKKYKIISIFVMPSSNEILIQRLISRWSENSNTMKRRLESMQFEIAHKNLFDYHLVNDELSNAINDFYQIIKSNI